MHTLVPEIDRLAPAKALLRFITCGSVDDGKSTLIGRLLHDSKLILDDQLSSLVKDSAHRGTRGEDIDFASIRAVSFAYPDGADWRSFDYWAEAAE